MRTLPNTSRAPCPSTEASPTAGLSGSHRPRRRAGRSRDRSRDRRLYPGCVRLGLAQVGSLVQVRGIHALPSQPEAVAAFLPERAEAGLSYASIDVACCAISYRHRQEGLIDPTTDPTLRRVRRGPRRIIGAAPRHQAHPLNVAELEQIVTTIDPQTPQGLRDRAIILLGYASAVRPSELSALPLADVATRPPRSPDRDPQIEDRPRRLQTGDRSRGRKEPPDGSRCSADELDGGTASRQWSTYHPNPRQRDRHAGAHLFPNCQQNDPSPWTSRRAWSAPDHRALASGRSRNHRCRPRRRNRPHRSPAATSACRHRRLHRGGGPA